MRVAAAIGVVLLLVGAGLAVRFLTDAPETASGTQVDVSVLDGSDTGTDSDPDSAGANESQTAGDGAAGTPAAGEPDPASATDGLPAPVGTPAAPSGGQSEGGRFELTLPIDCEIGIDCYPMSFVNAGPTSDPRDYACGSLTYSEHRGTDFRVIDMAQMEMGVDVIAAAPGIVAEVRDGMPDANFKLFGRSAVTDRGRGNVVVLLHDNGMRTIYSHLKRGSVAVGQGDTVRRGQLLGKVGLSGLTEFPHLQFDVVENGIFIDPFTGAARHEGCGLTGEPLWREDALALMPYPRTLVMRTGFANEVLNRAAVEYKLFDDGPIGADSDALVLHIYLAGIQPNDGFVAEITGPDGASFVKSGRRFDRHIMVRLLAVGRQDLTEPLMPGIYTGTFTYFRQNDAGEDVEILSLTETVEVR
jgi:murein DD-endopeptidase MepM/ murein hydrolase activator NlpD